MLSLRQKLSVEPDKAEAMGVALGIHGPSGIGKSVLAAALATDMDTRTDYTDGVYWISLTEEPDTIEHQQISLLRSVADLPDAMWTRAGARRMLRQVFADKRALIILDGVRTAEEILAFNLAESPSRLLFTCTDPSLLREFNAVDHAIEPLREVPSLKLLARASGTPVVQLPGAASRIADMCGHIPRALALAAGMAQKANGDWIEVLSALESVISTPNQVAIDGIDPHLALVIEASIENLGSDKDLYFDFAVIPAELPTPKSLCEALWAPRGLSPSQCAELLENFAARHLVDRSESAFRLASPLSRYICEQVSDLTDRHQRLLEGYASLCRDGWASGPDDGYYFSHLTGHLSAAGRNDDLVALLLDFRWLDAKLKATSTRALRADFYHAPVDNRPVRLVGEAVSMAAPRLTTNPNQLADQVIGRLCRFEDERIKTLVRQATENAPTPRFCLRTPSLVSPTVPLEHVMFGHTDWVTEIAINDDGTRAVSASWDNSVRVWDLIAGQQMTVLNGHTAPVTGLSICAMGRHAVSGSRDGTVRTWNLETGEQEFVFDRHTDWVRAVAISADGTRGASAGLGRRVRVWDLEAGTEAFALNGHSRRINSLAMTNDGTRIVSASSDMTVRVWDVFTGRELYVLEGHTRRVNVVAVSSDGKRAVSGGGDGSVRVWDLTTGKSEAVLSGHEEGIRAIALNADATRAISASTDHTIRAWDLETGSKLFSFNGHSEPARTVALTADGQLAISGGDDRMVRVWNLDTGCQVCALEGHTGSVSATAISPEGQRAVSAGVDATVRVWDLQTGKEAFVGEGQTDLVTPIAVSGDGTRAVHCGPDQTVQVWDLIHRRQTTKLSGHSDRVASVAISADGKRAVSASDDHTARIWDLDTGHVIKVLFGHTDAVIAVAINATGTLAASAGLDETVRGWDLRSGTEIAAFYGDAAMTSVSFTGETNVIAGSANGAVHLLDLEY
jgi:WD40 repeat protein